MKSFIVVFAVLVAAATALPSRWGGAPWGGAPWGGAPWGGAPWSGAPWGGAPWGAGLAGAGAGHWAGAGAGHWDGAWDDAHGPYSNVVAGNGAVSVGAAGPIRKDLGPGHGVAIVGPPTAPVKIIGPGATGKIEAEGLWGPTHAHGYGHGGHW